MWIENPMLPVLNLLMIGKRIQLLKPPSNPP
jgi:hypothetical protein